jgi:uncharacterized cupin superfamily protein
VRHRAPITSITLAALAALLTIPARGSEAPQHVLELPVSGGGEGKPYVETHDDGSIVVWTSFFRSPASAVGVGRANVSGRLTREKINYTDMIYVVNGSGTILDAQGGTTHPIKRGDFVLLPRGLDMEGRDFTDYIHFSAAFETQPNAQLHGTPKVQILHPEQLNSSEFERQGTSLRHLYYTGEGNVQVRVWQSVEPHQSTDFFVSPWSELAFIVSGTGSLTTRDGQVTQLQPGHAYLIPKGLELKVESHDLRKLAVVFDQETGAKGSVKSSE